MKHCTDFLFLGFLLVAGKLAAENNSIQSALLDDRVVYVIPVATNSVTTIGFPGPISAIDAVNVTADSKTPGQFQLAHTRGTAFLSVRALTPKATANLNVRWNKHTYVFELVETNRPVLSFALQSQAPHTEVASAPELTPTRLLALIDKAKAFPLLKQQHPDAVTGVEFNTYAERPCITDCNDYEIRLTEAFRFKIEDTLVFCAVLKNKTEHSILYRPGSFSIRAGNRIYPQSLSDAPGVMPPQSETTIYFSVTGTPDGGRNDLSLKNDFTVLLERLPSTSDPNEK
jgi:hypothetical protein